jgi:protein-S-isoprenylcysteine O-methyltransferase
MQRLINTALFVINLGSNRFSGYVNGVVNQYRAERKYLNYGWIEMSVLDRRLYEVLANAVLVGHEYYDNIPVQAAVLYAKHYWATAPPGAQTEVVDNAKGAPPSADSPVHSPQATRSPPPTRSPPGLLRYLPPVAIIGMLIGLSEIFLSFTRLAKSDATSRDRHSLKLIWLVILISVALAIVVAGRSHSWWNIWRQNGAGGGICALVSLGLVLRWYSVIYLGRFFTTNVAIAKDHRLVDTGPYRFIRHPSYTGSLLAMFGLALSFGNWASLVVLFVPFCAVILWRIHVEEHAMIGGLGEPYSAYMQRTRRLIPLLY